MKASCTTSLVGVALVVGCASASSRALQDSSDYAYLGCFVDTSARGSARVLTGDFAKDDPAMTTETCAEICEGSAYFGTEFSDECFCGLATDDHDARGVSSDCNMECSGDDTQTCGGRNAISVYGFTESKFVGCFVDSKNGRVLDGDFVKGNSSMTNDVCADFCADAPYYGTEYGNECFCAVEWDDPARLGEATNCDFACAGDDTQTCGGRLAISVYESPSPRPTGSTYLGYYFDAGPRPNYGFMDYAGRDNAMTNELCEVTCPEGSKYYATQYGEECWCGDESTNLELYGGELNDEDTEQFCTCPCNGDAEHICGGFYIASVYEY